MTCQRCTSLRGKVSRAQDDLRGSQGLLRRNGNKYGGRYITQLEAAKERLIEEEGKLADHVDEEHGGVMPAPDHSIFDRVSIPVAKPIPDGKAKCLACGAIATVINGERLRRHGKRGKPCPNVRLGDQPSRLPFPTPEVQIRQLSPKPAARARWDEAEPSRLDAGSACRECGKWLPGERILCGRCYATRGRAS